MRDSTVGLGLMVCLLISSLAAGTPLPQMWAYLITAAIYGIVLLICHLREPLSVRYNRSVLYSIALLWVVFVVAFALHPTGKATLRIGSFILFSAINLFVIPSIFTREQFVDGLAIVSTMVAGLAIPLALPSLVAGKKGLGIWQMSGQIMGTHVTGPVLTSIFWAPNYLAATSALGLIALIGFSRVQRRRRLAVVFAVFCLIGLVSSGGRAATLALVGAVILYLSYWIGGTKAIIPVIVIGVVAGLFLFGLAFGSVFGLDLSASFFNRRSGLWGAAVRAVHDRPLLGWGLVDTPPILAAHGAPTPSGNTLGSHNSYLRMFVQTGIVGGVLYLVMCAAVLLRSVNATHDGTTVSGVLLSLLGAFLTIQLFNGSTAFGLSLISSFGALIMGFGQNPDREIELPTKVRQIYSEIQHSIHPR